MPLSGKYDFPGIKKMGATALRVALSSFPATAWYFKVPGSQLVAEFIVNWLANKGLLILNLGAIIIDSEIDQHALDKAMDDALRKITEQGGRDKLTPEQKKAIDDEVIKAARKFIVIGKP